MHNTCISSTVSIRTNGSLSLSFSDYSYQWNERFEKSPSFQTTCCASCCSCCNHRVTINPSLLYGLRQSTLIQCPPARRLVLVGGERCYYRAPVYDIDRGSYGVSSCVKERIVGRSRGKRDNGRFDCRVSKGSRDWSHSGGDVEAEVMLSLLTEEVGEECFEVRKSDGGSFKRVQVEKKGNGGDQSYRRKKKNVESGSLRSNSKYEIESVAIESRNEGFRRKKKNVELDFLQNNSKDDNESVAIELRKEGYRRKLKNVESDSLRNNSKYENESVAIESSEEDYRRIEERKGLLRSENYRARKEGSSCSSYYSLSSSGDFERGDFESDTNLQITDVGDSSRQYKSDMRRTGEVRAEVVEEFKSHRDDKEESVEVSKQQNTDVRSYAGGSNVEWDWRKKSEKKLTEELIDETKCVKESSKEAFRVSGVQGSGSRNASVSDSEKQFDHREEKLRLGGNLDKETRKQYGQTGSEVIGQSISRINHPQVAEVSEIHGSNIQIISSSQKQYNGRGENVSAPANFVQEARETTGKDEWAKKSQPLRSLETLDIDIETASNLRGQSEIRRKNQEGNTIYALSSAGEAKEQHQTGEWATGQINSRRDTQQSSGVSEYRDNSYNKTSASHWQSEARMEIREESSDLTSSSGPEAKQQHFHTDANDSWKTGQRKGSQDASSVSVVCVADTKNVTKTVSTSDKRTTVRENYLTSSMKSAEETGDKHNQTDERKTRIGSRKEARPSEVSSNHESTSEEASSLQASINLVSQSRVQQISLQDSDKRSTQVLKPPPPRAKARESTAGLTATEPSGEMEEQESDATDTHQQGKTPEPHDELYGGFQKAEIFDEPVNLIPHEDALGSAARQEESSMHFVGEFVEKVRREVSTSEILKEKFFSELKSEYEGDKQMEKVVRYGSENIQLKEHESRHSSGVSGTKGPADEMWDVTGSSVQGNSKTEIPEGSTTTGTAVVKRTGRSLWSIIADVVQMRWGSHSKNHPSSVKSSKKSPSHESVSSESWYSGQELDEDKEKNINREKRSMLQESKSRDQLQPGKTSLKRQEGSNIMTGNDKITHVETDTSSSSGILQSALISLGVSLVSGEENSGESIRGSPSSSVIVESSLPLSSRQLRRSPAVELLGTGVADASGSGSMEELELPLGASLTEVSGTEGKDGELKRRKLQRNKQVPKDRFDEWEEVYNRESEQRKIDEMFMREALLEAKKAADSWEVPVGAVLVQHGKIIARGCNLVEELRDSTAHAEMICIREASNVLRTWRLAETTLYVTLEPCPMCAGAIIQARIETVVWGAPNKLLGADGSWIRLFPNGEGANILDLNDKPPPPVHPFHPKMTIRRGVMAAECADAMQHFFQLRRRKKEKTTYLPTPPSRLPVLSHPTKFFSKMHHLFNVMFCL